MHRRDDLIDGKDALWRKRKMDGSVASPAPQ